MVIEHVWIEVKQQHSIDQWLSSSLKFFWHVIHFLAGIQDKYSQVADDI